MNIRALAAQAIFDVVEKKQSLSTALPVAQNQAAEKDKSLIQEICFGVLRYLPTLTVISEQLIENPLKGKKRIGHFLILVGLYQLKYMRIPTHAAVSETVNAIKEFNEPRLAGFINGVLRNFTRQQTQIEEKIKNYSTVKHNHPQWLINLFKEQYPTKWEEIIAANNTKPPMWLRVNTNKISLENYLILLDEKDIQAQIIDGNKDAILLTTPCDVYTLPLFDEGIVSVQDGAAQLAIEYLEPQDNELILDACSAPGGKAAHILEQKPNVELIALDINANRLTRVSENLTRLNLTAKIVCGDATDYNAWWDGRKFDRILLDAPCSAIGVIRRHPDIKWLRTAKDIDNLSSLQANILDSMWELLKPGGRLVFATCSINKKENTSQIENFLLRTTDAQLVTKNNQPMLRQIIPGENNMDGFFYAALQKV